MKQPLQIRFIGLAPSAAVESAARVRGLPYEHLELGSEVQFVPELAAEGRQAKRVSAGKHHLG